MITPQFVGQRYKDTNTGNIWIANSTTPGDWTLELQNMQVQWQPRTSKFGELIGSWAIAGFTGITSITFLATTTREGFYLFGLDDLTTVSFPNLVSIDPTDFAGSSLSLDTNALLTSVQVPLLNFVAGNVVIISNPAITALSFPSLDHVGYFIHCDHNSSLTAIDISALTFLGDDFDANTCALNAPSVNGILAQLVSIAGWNKHCHLQGGTNAAPTGQGILDKATLIARGATVTTN